MDLELAKHLSVRKKNIILSALYFVVAADGKIDDAEYDQLVTIRSIIEYTKFDFVEDRLDGKGLLNGINELTHDEIKLMISLMISVMVSDGSADQAEFDVIITLLISCGYPKNDAEEYVRTITKGAYSLDIN